MSEKKQSEDQSASKICEFPLYSKEESVELSILADNPKYVCLECSRAAHNSANVCQPERMLSAWRP
jgi:hypothetical protein